MTQAQPTSIPYNGTGTINIHINNPSANVGGGMPPMPMMPMYNPYYPCCYPPNYYLGNMNPHGVTQITNVNTSAPKSDNADNNDANKRASADANAHATSEIKNDEKKKDREIVVLTDNYVKNLENYLKSSNVELRKDAVKELLLRFKEDKSRGDNPSLTALLNQALLDRNASVRAVAMSIIGSGYAKGDKLTEQILNELQHSKTNYSQDASQAAEGLLQMSKTKVKVPDNSYYPEQQNNNKTKGKG